MTVALEPRTERQVSLTVEGAEIHGLLSVPTAPRGLVIFTHACGGSRTSARNHQLAEILNDTGLATLICDLLTDEEETLNEITGEFRLDAKLCALRVIGAIDWCEAQDELAGLPVGLFGAGTGAAAAVIAALARRNLVRAMVMRGGRLDLAWSHLPFVDVPTLLVAGEHDMPVRAGYDVCRRRMSSDADLLIIPRAGHLFLEAGTLQELGEHAARWFARHLDG